MKAKKFLQVAGVATDIDGNVVLILRNGEAVSVKRINRVYSSAVKLESANNLSDRHILSVKEISDLMINSNIAF